MHEYRDQDYVELRLVWRSRVCEVNICIEFKIVWSKNLYRGQPCVG